MRCALNKTKFLSGFMEADESDYSPPVQKDKEYQEGEELFFRALNIRTEEDFNKFSLDDIIFLMQNYERWVGDILAESPMLEAFAKWASAVAVTNSEYTVRRIL